MKKFFSILSLVIFSSFSVLAAPDVVNSSATNSVVESEKSNSNASKSVVDLPKGYGGVFLGMNVDDAKKSLQKNHDFGYNGDRDVSLLPGENRVLIETDARDFARWSFLEQCWFQFSNDALYVITLNLNKTKVDYYSVFSSLCKKYGDPVEFSPERAVWKNDEVSMSLERPLALKYIDLKVFNSLVDESLIDKTTNEKFHDEFLESL